MKIIALIFAIAITVALTQCTNQGQTIKDYEHGSVLCVDDETTMIFINRGHEGDPEVYRLVELARTCDKEKANEER